MYSGNRFDREETTLRSAVHAPIGTERHDSRDSFLSLRDAHPCAPYRAPSSVHTIHPIPVRCFFPASIKRPPVQSSPVRWYLVPITGAPPCTLPTYPLPLFSPLSYPSIHTSRTHPPHPIYLISPTPPPPLPPFFSTRASIRAQPAGSGLANLPRRRTLCREMSRAHRGRAGFFLG